MKELRLLQYLGLGSVVLAMMACSEHLDDPGSEADEGAQEGGEGPAHLVVQGEHMCESYPLFADQDLHIGEVTVCNNDDLTITFETDRGWCMEETHVHVGEELDDFPLRGRWGNPAPGQFDYSEDHDPCVDEFTYEISMEDLDVDAGDALLIATHASVLLQGAELVANGDFEEPAVGTNAGWDVFEDGTPGLAWAVRWTDGLLDNYDPPETALLELQASGTEIPAGWQAFSGEQYAELDSDWEGPGGNTGNPASVRIYQDLATGDYQDCTLHYAHSPRPNHADNQLEVRLNDEIVGEHSRDGTLDPANATKWEEEEFDFSPNEPTMRLEFEEVGTPDSFGMFLDAVRVECEDRSESAWSAQLQEDIYLSDGPASVLGTDIYSVELDDFSQTAATTFVTEFENFFQAHIGHAPDENIIHAIDRDQQLLGLYDLDADEIEERPIAGLPAGLDGFVQGSTSPEGGFYVASQSDNNLYVVDVEAEPAQAELVGNTGINVSGADLAFTADGTLYLWTNISGQRGLYTVDRNTGVATPVGIISSDLPSLTGLAVRNGGYGALVGSEANSDQLHIISRDDGSIAMTYEIDRVHSFGDMTMGQFGQVINRFTEQGNWGTYIEYMVKPKDD